MSENPGKKKTAQQYAKVAEDCVKVGDLAGLDKAIQGLYEIASESSHIGDDVFNATVRTPYYGTIVGTFIIKAKNAFESFINDSIETWGERFHDMESNFHKATEANSRMRHHPMRRQIWEVKKACFVDILLRNPEVGAKMVEDSTVLEKRDRDEIFDDNNKNVQQKKAEKQSNRE